MPEGLPPGPRYPALIQGIAQWTRPLAFLERCRARYGKRFTTRFPLSPDFVVRRTAGRTLLRTFRGVEVEYIDP